MLQLEISPTRVEQAYELAYMHRESLRDTQPNAEAGITKDWVEADTARWLTEDVQTKFRRNLQLKIANASLLHQVAMCDGEIVGFVEAEADQEAPYQLLHSLYVATNLHHQGIGSLLMRQAEEFWDQDRPARLNVTAYNASAISFYRSRGFVVAAEPLSYYKEKVPQLTMERSIID